MKRKHKRLIFVGIAMVLLASATGLILTATGKHVSLFRTPSQLFAEPVPPDRRIRLGGLVENGSVKRGADATVAFRVTDTAKTVPVTYKGILPDLFREGQGVVMEGRMIGDTFKAEEVLAKHDENYMPPEVADAIKKSGQWKGQDKK